MPTKKPAKRKPVLKDSTRASDERLREELRNADMAKFAKGLAKAIRPPAKPRAE